MQESVKKADENLMIMPRKIDSESEKKFLTVQAERAKSRFWESVELIASEVLEKVNVVKWTKQHPLQSTSIAAGLGFVVAQGIPSQEEKKNSADENKPGEKPRQSSALSALLLPILYEAASDILKNTLIPFVQGATMSAAEEKDETRSSDSNL